MSFRSNMIVIGLLVLVTIGMLPTPLESQEESLILPVPDQSSDGRLQEFLSLALNRFEVALGAPALCGDDCDRHFLEFVSWIKSWACRAKACDNEGDKNPAGCVGLLKGESGIGESWNELMCDVIQSPGGQTRQAFIDVFPEAEEGGLVEGLAYVYALNGDVTACQDTIKNYRGPYGPAWHSRWYLAMAGCRILARESTREQEEKDFYRWFGGGDEGGAFCLEIVNSELRKACGTLGVRFFSFDEQ